MLANLVEAFRQTIPEPVVAPEPEEPEPYKFPTFSTYEKMPYYGIDDAKAELIGQ